jgi:hypothetical protein
MCTSSGDFQVSYGLLPSQSAQWYWFGDVACEQKAKLDASGKIALVHNIPDESYDPGMQKQLTDDDSLTFFRVLWSDEAQVSNIIQNCGSTPGCSTSSDGHCMCNVIVRGGSYH